MSSSSVIANNIDLLIQILLRLPVKSLFLFKSVSKQWFSLISADPYFFHKYNLHNRISVRGLFLSQWNSATFSNITSGECVTCSNDLSGMKILQSCNGLLCCRDYTKDEKNRCWTYYIHNPSIKHYKILPIFDQDSFFQIYSVSLAFDPIKSPCYQVVCIWRNVVTGYYQIEIYDSRTASWRLSGGIFQECNTDMLNKSGVFWNGSLHWISLRYYKKPFICFDVDQGLFRKMPVPQVLDDFGETLQWKIGYFGEYKGHLNLILINNVCTTCFEILEMDIDYRWWNVRYHVNLESLMIAFTKTIPGNSSEDSEEDEEDMDDFKFSILLVQEEDKGKSSNLIIHIPDRIICFDPKKMSFEETDDLPPSVLRGEGSLQYDWYSAHQYIESLVSV